jgi:hypothetical protein
MIDYAEVTARTVPGGIGGIARDRVLQTIVSIIMSAGREGRLALSYHAERIARDIPVGPGA